MIQSPTHRYISSAEMITGYGAIRQRLMNPANAVKQSRAAVVLKIVERAPEIIVARCRMPKDAHVEAYRLWQWEFGHRTADVGFYIRRRCAEIGAPYDLVTGRKRTHQPVADQKHLLIFEVYNKFDLSLPMIGRHFGGIDHTSVLFAVRKMEARMEIERVAGI